VLELTSRLCLRPGAVHGRARPGGAHAVEEGWTVMRVWWWGVAPWRVCGSGVVVEEEAWMRGWWLMPWRVDGARSCQDGGLGHG